MFGIWVNKQLNVRIRYLIHLIFPPGLKHQNNSTTVLQERNHSDSEQSRQNSTIQLHFVLSALQLKATEPCQFLPCVSWFSNKECNSSQHARHVQTECRTSRSTQGMLTQSGMELLIHSVQMLQSHLAGCQRGVTDVSGQQPQEPLCGVPD